MKFGLTIDELNLLYRQGISGLNAECMFSEPTTIEERNLLCRVRKIEERLGPKGLKGCHSVGEIKARVNLDGN